MSKKKKEDQSEKSAFELALISRVDKCISKLNDRIRMNNLVLSGMTQAQYDRWTKSYMKHWKKKDDRVYQSS